MLLNTARYRMVEWSVVLSTIEISSFMFYAAHSITLDSRGGGHFIQNRLYLEVEGVTVHGNSDGCYHY